LGKGLFSLEFQQPARRNAGMRLVRYRRAVPSRRPDYQPRRSAPRSGRANLDSLL